MSPKVAISCRSGCQSDQRGARIADSRKGTDQRLQRLLFFSSSPPHSLFSLLPFFLSFFEEEEGEVKGVMSAANTPTHSPPPEKEDSPSGRDRSLPLIIYNANL